MISLIDYFLVIDFLKSLSTFKKKTEDPTLISKIENAFNAVSELIGEISKRELIEAGIIE